MPKIRAQTHDEIISTMDVEQHIRRLEILVTVLVEYIDRYNISNVVKANHQQLLSLNRDEALHRNRINYEARNHDDDNDNDNEMAVFSLLPTIKEVVDRDLNKAYVAVTVFVSYESQIRCVYVLVLTSSLFLVTR